MGFSEPRVSDAFSESVMWWWIVMFIFFQWWACTTCTGWWDVMIYWHRNGHTNGKHGQIIQVWSCRWWVMSVHLWIRWGAEKVARWLEGTLQSPHSFAGKSHILMLNYKWSFSMVAEFGWLWHYPLVKSHNYGKSPCYQWVKSLFLWPSSSSQTVSLPQGIRVGEILIFDFRKAALEKPKCVATKIMKFEQHVFSARRKYAEKSPSTSVGQLPLKGYPLVI